MGRSTSSFGKINRKKCFDLFPDLEKKVMIVYKLTEYHERNEHQIHQVECFNVVVLWLTIPLKQRVDCQDNNKDKSENN